MGINQNIGRVNLEIVEENNDTPRERIDSFESSISRESLDAHTKLNAINAFSNKIKPLLTKKTLTEISIHQYK